MIQEFVAQLEALVKENINNIHTALPGQIVSVDTKTGLAVVLPKAQMKFSNGAVLDFPKISGVPLVFPFSSSADAEIAFPVKAGDQCLIIISEQALDYWLGVGETNTEIKFGLSNAIAIPGLMRSMTVGFKEANETDSIVIRAGNNQISLSKRIIAVRGDISVDGNLLITGEIKNANSGDFEGGAE